MASNYPMLPGYTPNQPIDQTNFKKVSAEKQQFNRESKNKPQIIYNLPRRQAPCEPKQEGMFNPNYMSTTHDTYIPHNVTKDCTELYQPTWVKMDRQVLRFYGYFKESCVESALESYRLRKLVIYFYLEDNSCEIIEKKQMNSGIPQGAFLKRQKVLKQDKSGLHLDVNNFTIGQDVEFYGKNIKIIDCDQYTREFYETHGSPQPEGSEMEKDNWESKTLTKYIPQKDTSMMDYLEHKLGGGRIPSQKQFLENDRKVLKFYVHSEVPYILHYYLADDTMEIREINYDNSGRDHFPLMLRRQKLPRKFALNQPGQTYAEDFIKPEHIFYGEELDVYGRKFQINGCDPYTNIYYKERIGRDFPISGPQTTDESIKTEKHIPPYNGFGDEQDSLGYVFRLQMKPPKKDFFKWVDNQVNLRFVAKFNTIKAEDIDRVFVITFFLNDDSIMIYEPSVRNSGIPDGKFLERKKYKNIENNNEFFTPTDLIVGKDVRINSHSFKLQDCDEFTKKWYAKNVTTI